MNDQSNALKFVFTLLLITFMAVGCSKMEEEPTPSPAGSFQAVFNTGGALTTPTTSITSEILSEEEVLVGNTQFSCTTERLAISAAGGGDSGFPLFSPNASVIYPGAMLQGNSLQNGNPDLIALERGSGIISTDILDGNIQSSFEVEVIAKGSVTDAINSDQFILINKAGNQYLRSTGGTLSGPHPINDLLGDELPFAGIGAACMDYTALNPDRLLAFDLSGINFAVFDNGTWGPVNSIASFAGGMHPFNLTGVGAMAHAPYVIGSGANAPGGDNAYHFNATGTKYARWYSLRNSSGVGHIPMFYEHFTGVRDLYEWGVDDSVTNTIPDVGAAIGFQQGDDHFTILFNKAGTKYVVYGNVNGDNPNEVVGPFDL